MYATLKKTLPKIKVLIVYYIDVFIKINCLNIKNNKLIDRYLAPRGTIKNLNHK